MVELHLSQDADADALLSRDPFALLVGMVLDQQVPLEWAFAAPAELVKRLRGRFDPAKVQAMEPDALGAVFSTKPALHRYPGSMATRVHALATVLCDEYDGRAENVWSGVTSGAELFGRVRRLPGFGEQKAKIFVALLGKQLGVRPPGWKEVSAPFSDPGSFRSVADITGLDTLQKVRAFKADLKAAAKRTGPAAAVGSGPATGKAATGKAVAGKRATTNAPSKEPAASKTPATATTSAAARAASRSTAGKARGAKR